MVFLKIICLLRKDGGIGMDKQLLKKFYENKTKIKLNLKNGRFYTGIILGLYESSLLFKDKYGKELPFSLDSISYIDVAEGDNNGR